MRNTDRISRISAAIRKRRPTVHPGIRKSRISWYQNRQKDFSSPCFYRRFTTASLFRLCNTKQFFYRCSWPRAAGTKKFNPHLDAHIYGDR